MNNELLNYYQRELIELNRLQANFSKDYPEVFGASGLNASGAIDPHTTRLIEAIALLNARIHCKLDETLPEDLKSLLYLLYPHYQAPLPSMAITQFSAAKDLNVGYTIRSGTLLEIDPACGAACQFRTCYDTEVLPLEVTDATILEIPPIKLKNLIKNNTLSVLRIKIRCLDKDLKISSFNFKKLRFYLNCERNLAYKIYSLLLNDVNMVALASPLQEEPTCILNDKTIYPVGFADNEYILPSSCRTFSGFQLLSEFFVFPEKFFFFDLVGLEKLSSSSNELEIYFCLRQGHYDLKSIIKSEHFALGCTPIVNLFSRLAEPINLDHTLTEYPIIPDIRKQDVYEIYTVDQVFASTPNGEKIEIQPFYGLNHAKRRATTFWHLNRQPSFKKGNVRSDLFLSLVDISGAIYKQDNWIINVITTCSNGNLPRTLFNNGASPRLQLTQGSAPISHISWRTVPTPSYTLNLENTKLWQLFSHLSLNYLSLFADEGKALRETLQLYNFPDGPEAQSLIANIQSAKMRHTIARLPNNLYHGFCQGSEITIDLDKRIFQSGRATLFGNVLEQFLKTYCSINSFIKLIFTTDNYTKVLHQWTPKSGTKQLL